MAVEDVKKGDGGAEISTEAAHGVGLGGTVATDDGEVTEENGG